MTSTTTPAARSHPIWSAANLQGLAIAVVLGLADIGFTFVPVEPNDGTDGPPVGILVLGFIVGLATILLAARAWRTGSRGNLRAVAGLRILSLIAGLPGFFVDIDAWIKIVGAVQVLLTIACLVLMFKPAKRGPVLD